MSNKANYLSYGFIQIPRILSTTKKFTHAEKLIIGKILDMMWKNSESNEYAGCAWPSNSYLQKLCDVSESTIIRCKKKVKALGVFDIIKRWNSTDIWKLKPLPDIFIEEYEELIQDMQSDKEERSMSNKEFADLIAGMDDGEVADLLIKNPNFGKLSN
jgi:hypothetical protein